MNLAFINNTCNAFGIAVIHTLFNVGCVLVLYPFSNQLVKLAQFTIKDDKQEEVSSLLVSLDSRFIDQPSFALDLCRQAIVEMATLSKEAFCIAMDTIKSYSKEKVDMVYALEEKVNVFDDTLNNYLVKISSKDLSKQDSQLLTMMLHCLNDIERISDHSINVVKSVEEMVSKNIQLTDKGQLELNILSDAIYEILNLTFDVFKENNIENARHIEPLEETIDYLCKELKTRHIERLKNGECALEAGLVLEEIIINYERVSDHCSNIAIHMIQSVDEFKKHEYLRSLVKDNHAFEQEYRQYRDVYALPI